MGPSGSGESALTHCMAGLDTVSSGSARIGSTELGGLKDKQLTRLRRDQIGFVVRSFNLPPTLTALENITLPMDILTQERPVPRPRSIWAGALTAAVPV
jgi:putative ABC transport system ATP-binding protein